WLYCRAAQQHGVRSENDLALFARTCQERAESAAYYAQRQWNFEDVEYLYLERSAEVQPGQFPAALGPEYPARGEELLLARPRRLEEAGRREAALAAVEVLLKLSPHNRRAHDRLAGLYFRAGRLDQAAGLLAGWRILDPQDPLPLIRQAVIE